MERKINNEIIIEKILKQFIHGDKIYILFSIDQSPMQFLYFSNKSNTNHSLVFGKNLLSSIKAALKIPNIECLECQMGISILGGVSLDDECLVDWNLTVDKANQILNKLNVILKQKDYIVKYF